MSNNSTLDRSGPETDLYSIYKITWTAAFCLQFVVAMIANFLIVGIVYRDSRLKITTNYLIANMAASDLIGGLFFYTDRITKINFDHQWLIGGDIGNALCKITYFTAETSFSVSIYSCIAIAIDRYFAVVHPFKRPLQGKLKHVIASIWIIAAVIKLPLLYLVATHELGDILYCTASVKNQLSFEFYLSVLVVLEVALPMGFITITCTLTIRKLFRHKVLGLRTSERRRRVKKKKVLKHAVTIVVLLYLGRGFFITFMLLDLQGKLDHLWLLQYKTLEAVTAFILFFSLVYNFFIYLIFNDIYRENIKALIRKCCCRYNTNRRQGTIPAGGEIIEMQAPN